MQFNFSNSRKEGKGVIRYSVGVIVRLLNGLIKQVVWLALQLNEELMADEYYEHLCHM